MLLLLLCSLTPPCVSRCLSPSSLPLSLSPPSRLPSLPLPPSLSLSLSLSVSLPLSLSLSLSQVAGGAYLCSVHGSSQPGDDGEDEVSVLPVRHPGPQRRQVSLPAWPRPAPFSPSTHTHTHSHYLSHTISLFVPLSPQGSE